MRIIAYIILTVIVGIIALFTFLNWLTARTYKSTPTEVADKLRRVLNGTMTWDEWDEFTCVPMRHNDDLDSIRRRCVEMETSEFCTRENSQEQETWIYNQKGLDEVKKLLTELEKGIQPAGGAYVSPAAGDPTAHP